MNLEHNKILAAVLVAGIVACLSGFVSELLVRVEDVAAHGPSATQGASAAPAAPSKPEPIMGLIAAADVEVGKKISKACAACHTFDKGGANGVGPNLWGAFSHGRGQVAGFAYSEDLKALGGKWDYADLNHFLWKPKSFIKGTKMGFIGVKKPEDRAAVIAFLRTLEDSPPALPSAATIAAEAAALAPPAAAAQ